MRDFAKVFRNACVGENNGTGTALAEWAQSAEAYIFSRYTFIRYYIRFEIGVFSFFFFMRVL